MFTLLPNRVDENGHNPSWSAIGYCGPDPKASAEEKSHKPRPLEGKVLALAEHSKDEVATFLRNGDFALLDNVSHLQHNSRAAAQGTERGSLHQPQSSRAIGVKCDVVVVGSGCGGGVIAGVLAKAGYKVLVLEKGEYFARGDLSLLEKPSYQAMYEGGAILGTDDGSVALQAGATVGGGTAINWCASLKTPDHVRQEWAKEYGLSFFARQKYQDALDKVCARGSVGQFSCERQSLQNQTLTDGCKSLGYDIGQVPRNVRGEHSCGWCHLGCKTGEKQATSETWLVDAVQAGALILSTCTVHEVLHREDSLSKRGKRAVGVKGGGGGLTLYVEAAVTVVCGGSLNTPPLLLRSGLTNPNIGKHLHLHPVLIGWGYFPQGKGTPAGTGYEGTMISAVSKEAANWNSSGYGALLEVPILHAAAFACLMPWRSGADHKGRMRKFPRTSCFLAITRDRGSGRVGLSRNKEREITYSVAPEDEDNLFQAFENGLRVLVAAGAEEVGGFHMEGQTFSLKATDSSKAHGTEEEDFHKFLHGVKKRRLDGAKTPVSSAHQMGTCRMGVDSRESVVDASCEAWEVEDLFLGDASVFPTASGVNPMITVQGIAYCTAQNIMLKLQEKRS